jgi:iduronate 2-sulfatase
MWDSRLVSHCIRCICNQSAQAVGQMVCQSFTVALPWVTFICLTVASNSMLAVEPYNVLFIAADDLRTDLGCYGHPLVKTPNLDRLAARGMVFQSAYCQQALCNPSRASIMTGRRVDSLRVWDLRTHFRETMPDVVTLPQHLMNHGYFTQNVGKIFHNWIHQIQGDPQSWSVPAQMHFANHGSDLPQSDHPLPPNLASDRKCECRDLPDEAYFDGRVAELAVQALRERAKATQAQGSQPFFLAVGFWKPHSPFNAPKRYWDKYSPAEITAPENSQWPQDTPRIAWHNSREILGEGETARELSPEATREIRHGYLANISYLDAQVGKVLDELDRLKLTEKTIVVFWSDHGFHLGEHTLWAKTSNFELDARVPLIIAVPNGNMSDKHKAVTSLVERSPGPTSTHLTSSMNSTDALVELLDLYPTLVELCGLEPASSCEGTSLVPILADPQAVVRQAALTQHPRPAYYIDRPAAMGYSIRSSTHRYTEWRDWQSGETVARELYDHRQDAAESVNLADKVTAILERERHSRLLIDLRPVVFPGWQLKRP